MHFRGVPSGSGSQIASETDDDNAIDLAWSISVPGGFHLHLALEPVEKLAMEAPILAGAGMAPVWLHSHDPPLLRPQNPRAPPA